MKGIRLRGDDGFTPLDRSSRHLTGFTLLEIVIALSLLGLVGLSFAYLYSTSQRFMIQSVNAASTQTEASFALEHIKRKLTPATAVNIPLVGASGPVLNFTWQQDAGTPAQTSQYGLNGTDLQFIQDTAAPGPPEVIARGIQKITFNRATAGTISVDVTAQKASGGDTRTTHLQTNISPRGLLQ